jgi:eukaryotic-like serine/threonine-protein kinase
LLCIAMSTPPNTPSTPPQQNSTVLNNRYRLLAIVASGGMATVYKAQDMQLNRLVAIKMLRDRYARDPQFVQRFREEAQAAANLNHPNIVTIFDVGSDTANGADPNAIRHFIVMEFLEGADLKQTLRERQITNNPITINQSVDFARQICEGVGYAHRRGLAHCDLKPQNVMISPDGHAEVADFGIARAFTAALANQKDDVVWGTPQYFSPEQATGAIPTPASDVYSIGVMLYELLAGQLPFQANDPQQLARLHMTAEATPLHLLNPNVSLQLEAIVRRAMSKDPAQRYHDADQMARVLTAYLQQGMEQTISAMPAVKPLTEKTPPTMPASPMPAAAQPTQPSTPHPRAVPVQVPSAQNTRPAVVQPTQRATTPNVTRAQTGNYDPTTVYNTQQIEQQGGTDILLLLLAAIALLCVLGLIPLWVTVYQRYTAPPTPSQQRSSGIVYTSVANGETMTRTVAVTSSESAELPKVPALLGKPLEQASQELNTLGYKIKVTHETTNTNPSITQTMVISQMVAAGTALASGSEVELGVSKPMQAEPVPDDLVGKLFDDAISKTLSSKAWTIVTTETLSFKPEGEILSVAPPSGEKLAVSGTLTLTLSTGGRINLEAKMPGVVVDWAKFNRETYGPGQTIDVEVQWRATRSLGKDYNVAWFLLGRDGFQRIAQGQDRAPQNQGSTFPTSAWGAGTVIVDRYRLQIPADIASGAYSIEIGLYDGGGRLGVTDAGKGETRNGLLVLRTIQIQ